MAQITLLFYFSLPPFMKRTIRFFGAILILVKLKLALDYIPFNNCLVSIAKGTLNRNQFREALSSRMHRTTDASRGRRMGKRRILASNPHLYKNKRGCASPLAIYYKAFLLLVFPLSPQTQTSSIHPKGSPLEQMATENVVSFLLSRPTVSAYSRTQNLIVLNGSLKNI